LVPAPEFDHVSSYAPFFEIDPHWHDDGRFREPAGFEDTSRRMFNTHLLFDMLPHAKHVRYQINKRLTPQAAIHKTGVSKMNEASHVKG